MEQKDKKVKTITTTKKTNDNSKKDVEKILKHYQKIKTDKELVSTTKKSKPKTKLVKKEVEEDNGLKIGIVGIGSIGTPISVLLASSGYDVEITKKNTNSLVIDNCVNLEINGSFGDRSYLVPCVQNNKFTSKKDIIIMCTQAFSTAGALKEVKKFLKPNGIVVSLQNVLNINEVLKVIPKERYVALVVDWTATRLEQNHVLVLRQADMHIGVFDDKAKVYLPLVKKLLDCVQPTIIHDDIYSFIAGRFVLSCTLSCVIAITGHNLKNTIADKVAKKLIVGAIKEMLDVFEAYNVKVPPYCDNLDYYKFVKRGLQGAMYRKQIFHRFATQNGDMSSSILRDLENKKKTELDSMCNRIVEMAKVKGIEVPFNETIANFLYDVEDGKETIFMGNLEKPCFTNLKINWR